MIKSFIPITISSAIGFQCFNSTLDFLPPPPGKYEGKDRHRWRNAATSLLHAVIMSCIVVYCLYKHPELWSDPEMYYTVSGDVGFAVISGYLIYDTYDLMVHSHFSKVSSLVAHHLIMFFTYILLSVEQKAMGILIIGLLCEVSAIFLHSRQLLLMYGFSKRSLVYRVHSIFNLVAFILLRILPLINAAYASYVTQHMPTYLAVLLPFLTTPILLINFVLLWRLLRGDFMTKSDEVTHVMDN